MTSLPHSRLSPFSVGTRKRTVLLVQRTWNLENILALDFAIAERTGALHALARPLVREVTGRLRVQAVVGIVRLGRAHGERSAHRVDADVGDARQHGDDLVVRNGHGKCLRDGVEEGVVVGDREGECVLCLGLPLRKKERNLFVTKLA